MRLSLHRPDPLRVLALLPFGALFAACADSPPAAGDPAAPGAPARWSLEEELRIGSVDGPDALDVVADLAPTPDGRLAAVLPRRGRVLTFDRDGRAADSLGRRGRGPGELIAPGRIGFLGNTVPDSLGRRGRGPGELIAPGRIGFLGDTVWVHDGGQRRISRYGPDGAHLDDRPVPAPPSTSDDSDVRFGAVLADGRTLLALSPRSLPEPLDPTRPRPLLAVGPEDRTVDTLAFRRADRERLVFRVDGRWVALAEPMGDHALWAVPPGGGHVVVVDRTVATGPGTASYRVTRVGLDGDTIYSVAVEYRPRPLEPERVDSMLALFEHTLPFDVDLRERLFLPEYRPPVSEVLTTDDGSVWLAREAGWGDELQSWDVLGPDGHHRARFDGPAGLRRPFAVTDDALWALTVDDLDVPYLVRHRIVGR